MEGVVSDAWQGDDLGIMVEAPDSTLNEALELVLAAADLTGRDVDRTRALA